MYCLPDIKERDSIFVNSSQKVDATSIVEFWIDFQKSFLVIGFDCFSLPNVLVVPLASLLPIQMLPARYFAYKSSVQLYVLRLSSTGNLLSQVLLLLLSSFILIFSAIALITVTVTPFPACLYN